MSTSRHKKHKPHKHHKKRRRHSDDDDDDDDDDDEREDDIERIQYDQLMSKDEHPYTEANTEEEDDINNSSSSKTKHKYKTSDFLERSRFDTLEEEDHHNHQESGPLHLSTSALQRLTSSSSSSSSSSSVSSAATAITEEPEWVPVPATELQLPVPYKRGEYCFMCDTSQNRMEMISNPRYTALKKVVDDHYGLMDPLQLWTMVQKLYNEDLRPCTVDQKEWSISSIAHHFTVDAASPVIMLEEALRVVNSAMHTLKEECIFLEERRTKKRMLDGANLRLYLSLLSQQRVLMSEILGKRSSAVS
jgi:hypothetical protein